MTIIASCGHCLTEDERHGQLLAIASYSRDHRHAIEYVSYCNACANDAYKSGKVLLTDEDMTEWLNLNSEYEYDY
jgi:hypothetical protein